MVGLSVFCCDLKAKMINRQQKKTYTEIFRLVTERY
jgi:hypothetical protein